jgi:hypothetical protein
MQSNMINGNWVCFDCRTCVRRQTLFRPSSVGDKGNESVKCPECNQPCRFLGTKISIPPKRDVDEWKQLRRYVIERRTSLVEQQSEQNTHRKHDIERRIRDLENRPKNKQRNSLIKQLQDELANLL